MWDTFSNIFCDNNEWFELIDAVRGGGFDTDLALKFALAHAIDATSQGYCGCATPRWRCTIDNETDNAFVKIAGGGGPLSLELEDDFLDIIDAKDPEQLESLILDVSTKRICVLETELKAQDMDRCKIGNRIGPRDASVGPKTLQSQLSSLNRQV